MKQYLDLLGHVLKKGDVVYQPPEIHHREIEHSDDLELIEITSPSKFETFTV